MWISEKFNSNNKSKQAFTGKVTLSNKSTVNVQSDTEYKNVPLVLPYGIFCKTPLGEKMYLLPTAADGIIAIGSAVNNNYNLQEGELMLYSKGGAKIILKNDGSVVINNTVIEAGE